MYRCTGSSPRWWGSGARRPNLHDDEQENVGGLPSINNAGGSRQVGGVFINLFFYFLLVSKVKKRVQLYGEQKSCRKLASYKRTILRKKKCGVVRTVQLYGARKSCKNRAEVNALMHNELDNSKRVVRTTAQFFSIYKAPPRINFYIK
jgi:hypothetical protein